jgi:polyphenol oxidase
MTLTPVMSELLGVDRISHGFFTREGGVSEGIYAGLNGGVGSADSPVHVQENRTRVQQWLGADALLSLAQVHGVQVVSAAKPWDVDARPQADAMVTNQCGIALGILTADCVPVLFADMHAGVVGAAHAGWKGAVAGITDATIRAMEALGARRKHIVAVVGPCIAQASYEVSADFLQPFMAESDHNGVFFAEAKQGKYYFDVRGYVAQRMRDQGVGSIEVLPHDTYTLEQQFYSYRRCCHRGEHDYGRQISAIMLR